jgi:hypothetical protein
MRTLLFHVVCDVVLNVVDFSDYSVGVYLYSVLERVSFGSLD